MCLMAQVIIRSTLELGDVDICIFKGSPARTPSTLS